MLHRPGAENFSLQASNLLSQVVPHQYQPPTGDSLWVVQCPWATDIPQKLHGPPLQGASCKHYYPQYRHFNSLRCPSSISSWSEYSKREFLLNRERYGGNKNGFTMPGYKRHSPPSEWVFCSRQSSCMPDAGSIPSHCALTQTNNNSTLFT